VLILPSPKGAASRLSAMWRSSFLSCIPRLRTKPPSATGYSLSRMGGVGIAMAEAGDADVWGRMVEAGLDA